MPNTATDHESYRGWKSWDRQKFGLCEPVDARYFEAEFERSGVRGEDGFPVLEVGFGNGAFAAWAIARHWDYSGTELDPELVDRARGHGWRAFPATLEIDTLGLPAPQRCIVMLDVLEHLPLEQIPGFLQAARRTLADGGLLIARLPSGDSPFARHIQHGDITHLSTIGSGAMRQLARAAGLDIVQLRSPVFPLTGGGVRRWMRRALVKSVRAITSSCLRVAYHDNQPTVITANMLVVMRKTTGLQSE